MDKRRKLPKLGRGKGSVSKGTLWGTLEEGWVSLPGHKQQEKMAADELEEASPLHVDLGCL